MSAFLCARPHAKTIDFSTARLVVARDSGVEYGDASGVHRLGCGAEIPLGVLSAEALRQMYEPPLRMIETLEFVAAELPELRAVCEAQGVCFTPAPSATSAAPEAVPVQSDLANMNRRELAELCDKADLPTHGTVEQLRGRLAAAMARGVDRRGRGVRAKN